MERIFYERSLQNESDQQEELERQCSRKTWCGACLQEEGCSWCNGNSNSSGSCHMQEDPPLPCRQAVTDSSQCPSVGADVSSYSMSWSATTCSKQKNCLYLPFSLVRAINTRWQASLLFLPSSFGMLVSPTSVPATMLPGGFSYVSTDWT